MAAADPDSYGMDSQTTKTEVMRSSSGYGQTVEVYENGYFVEMIIDFDDVGGDSYNHAKGWIDSAGAFSPKKPANLGKKLSRYENEALDGNWRKIN